MCPPWSCYPLASAPPDRLRFARLWNVALMVRMASVVWVNGVFGPLDSLPVSVLAGLRS